MRGAIDGYNPSMSRTPEDYAHELQALDAAHAQNEAGRDAFIALAHTALFAASVSFVGDVAPLTEAIWRPALIAGWLADVVGLLALTISFGAARRAIDARRAALNDSDPPSSFWPDLLNGVALWSFPAALLCLFSFVTANVVTAHDRKVQPTTATVSKLREARCDATSPGAEPRRIKAVDGGSARTTGASTSATATSSPTAKQEVRVPSATK